MSKKNGLKVVDLKKASDRGQEKDPLSGNGRIKRGLRAILSADVKGYSRLMSQDEMETIQTLKYYRSLIEKHTVDCHGRIVDSPGDNILAEFSSVVDAVEAAVIIQKELRLRNEKLPHDRKMMFRMGINLGDVLVEEGRIYGDGVNIAARLEGLSEGGGICISGTVYDQVKNKLDLQFDYLGEQTVKNIFDPVRVYRVVFGDTEAVSSSGKKTRSLIRRGISVALGILIVAAGISFFIWKYHAPSIHDKAQEPGERGQHPMTQTSIAVLPFANNSGDSSQDYFIDGITENLITVLSKTPGLLVISRESSFFYRDESVEVQKIGQDLGVLYILKGSMQKSEDTVRISVQLLDTGKGELLWAERYDRTMKDIFALQDEITMKIINALNIHLSHGEQMQIMTRGTENLDAYLKVLEGMGLLRSSSHEDMNDVKSVAQEAIRLDPNYGKGYILLAMAEMRGARSKGPPDTDVQEKILEILGKAIALDPRDPMAYEIMGNIYYQRRDYEQAIIELEKVVAINPNSTEGLSALGRIRLLENKPLEAISLFEEARKRDPLARDISIGQLGQAYFMAKEYEEAISIYKEINVKRRPDDLFARTNLIACYMALGNTEEAARHVSEILKIDPDFSIENFSNAVPYRDPATKEHYLDLLRRAGLE